MSVDLERDMRDLLLAELTTATAHPDRLAQLATSDLLVTYANWSLRHPPARPRTVHLSCELGRLLGRTDELSDSVRAVLQEIADGADLSDRLSSEVAIAWVPPEAKRRQRLRALDRYLFAWGIHHLHLGQGPSSRHRRTADLLFVCFVGEHAFGLNALPHQAWNRDQLLRIAAENWPDDGPLLLLRGVIGLERPVREQDRVELRNGNVSTFFEHAGHAYAPRDSLTLAGTSMRATRWATLQLHNLDRASDLLSRTPERLSGAIGSQPGVARIGGWRLTVVDGYFAIQDGGSGGFLSLDDVAALASRLES